MKGELDRTSQHRACLLKLVSKLCLRLCVSHLVRSSELLDCVGLARSHRNILDSRSLTLQRTGTPGWKLQTSCMPTEAHHGSSIPKHLSSNLDTTHGQQYELSGPHVTPDAPGRGLSIARYPSAMAAGQTRDLQTFGTQIGAGQSNLPEFIVAQRGSWHFVSTSSRHRRRAGVAAVAEDLRGSRADCDYVPSAEIF